SAGKPTDLANRSAGVQINGASKNNVIGTNGDGSSADANEGNVISGNVGAGVIINGAGRDFNGIAGNRIGTNAAGTSPRPHDNLGINLSNISGGPAFTRIGTNGDNKSDTLERNVVSGNMFQGIGVGGSNDSVIAGNYIGTDAGGTYSITNGAFFGINISGG